MLFFDPHIVMFAVDRPIEQNGADFTDFAWDEPFNSVGRKAMFRLIVLHRVAHAFFEIPTSLFESARDDINFSLSAKPKRSPRVILQSPRRLFARLRLR